MAIAIEYRRLGRLPTCIGNERIRVTADGQVAHSRNVVECAEGQAWSAEWTTSGRLDAPALAALEQDIRGSGLLEMAPQSIDDTAEGGVREELDVTLDERDYHWVVENVPAPALRAVVARLRGVVRSTTR